jgi:ribonuclease HI
MAKKSKKRGRDNVPSGLAAVPSPVAMIASEVLTEVFMMTCDLCKEELKDGECYFRLGELDDQVRPEARPLVHLGCASVFRWPPRVAPIVKPLPLQGDVAPATPPRDGDVPRPAVKVTCWFDGACWPNPGHASSGALVKVDGVTVYEHFAYHGSYRSNNVAEYQGIIAVFRYLLTHALPEAEIFGDSMMVVQQMNGRWKAKPSKPGQPPKLYLDDYQVARALRARLPKVVISWIPREENTEADALSQKPLVERGIKNPFGRS